MVIGDDLIPGLDDLGGLADVGEVLPRRDLRVGDAVVRHQRSPWVKSDLKSMLSWFVLDTKIHNYTRKWPN